MPDREIERLAARQIADLLANRADGDDLTADIDDDLQATLESLIPAVLRPTYPEWESESLDGFFFASAVKTAADSLTLTGTCILIRDQTVTPFTADISKRSGRVLFDRIRLGESGGGALGISGPTCNTGAASRLLDGLATRLDKIEWVYDIRAGDIAQ
jgi:hypothetical protein